jgi:outer membrane murein-binding lipoprotein Lpp
MKKMLVLLAALAVFLIAGCKTVYTPLTVTTNPVGTKVGEATANVGQFGGKDRDYSIQTAAKNAGITKIATVDIRHKYSLIPGLVNTYTTIVTGE